MTKELDDAVDTSADETVAELDPAVESEARRSGWIPKESFKGRESDWVDADTFVRQGRIVRPILKENNARLEKELAEAKGELAELKLTTQEFAAEFAKMRENAYKRAIADLRVQKREAREKGEDDIVDDLEDRIDSLKEEQAKKAAEPKKEAPKAAEPDLREFREWQSENKWYDEEKEPDMFDAAEAIALRLSRTESGLVGRPYMDRITELVKAKFPDKFENPRRKTATHEGGSARGESKRGHTYADLPAEGKKACDRYVRQGLMTREQYIDSVEWD